MLETTDNKNDQGFTLIELIIVVLIVGIIAAIAVPKMFDIAGNARESTAKQSLSVVREAIEYYKSVNGEYPASGGGKGAEKAMKEDLAPFLNGPFPSVPEEIANGKVSGVKVYSDTTVLYSNGEDGTTKKKMWAYNTTTGEFIINYNGVSPSGVPYDEL